MADFEIPSFSLGLDLDLDLDPDPQPTLREDSTLERAPDTVQSCATLEDDNGELGPQVPDSDPDSGEEPPRLLRRLKRGPAKESTPMRLPDISRKADDDDDIEDFSSEEDLSRAGPSSTQHQSICSTSKFPLQRHGLLPTTHSATQSKRKQVSNAPTSANLESITDKVKFPRLTISPLRRFQLLDSDSDSDPDLDDLSVNEEVSLSKEKQSNSDQNATVSQLNKTKASVGKPQNEDLWKDFQPMKSVHIPTPVLDEVCEEYFRSVKEKNVVQKQGSDAFISNNRGFHEMENISPIIDLSDPVPPAHRYFSHNDLRIQNLVRTQLCNFSPLGGIGNRGNIQLGSSVIDYMSQFCYGEASKQKETQNGKGGRSSAKGRRNSKAGEVSHESWVNPRQSVSVPKDAGRRRVHANGNSTGGAGHWYTGSNGKRVYVTKDGKELTGQMAYRHYKKESGGWLKKKKSRAKKKKN